MWQQLSFWLVDIITDVWFVEKYTSVLKLWTSAFWLYFCTNITHFYFYKIKSIFVTGGHTLFISSPISLKFKFSFMRFRVLFELFQVQEQIFLPSLSSFRLVRMLKITTFKITGLNRLQFDTGFHQHYIEGHLGSKS